MPVVPVAFPQLDPHFYFPALVDSGAHGVRVSVEIAHQMNLDLRRAEKGRLLVAGNRHTCWYVTVPMRIQRYTWNCEVGFADGWSHNHSLLGMRGFFEQFKVLIDTRTKTTTLTPLRHPGSIISPPKLTDSP